VLPQVYEEFVRELDRLRAEQMAQYNFDFEAFYRDLKEQEKLLPQVVQPPPETPPNPRFYRTTGFAAARSET
jgi:hypothetical protein